MIFAGSVSGDRMFEHVISSLDFSVRIDGILCFARKDDVAGFRRLLSPQGYKVDIGIVVAIVAWWQGGRAIANCVDYSRDVPGWLAGNAEEDGPRSV
jgi:hypothetical protein